MTSTPAPRFVWVALVAGVLSLVLSVAVVWQIQRQNTAETQRDCVRAVAIRDDGRAMWLYVVATSTGGDKARIDAFVAELNRRLPQLECRGGNALPVK